MDEMIYAFYIIDHIQEDKPNCPMKPIHELPSHLQERHAVEHTSKEEAELKRLACLPLYVGATKADSKRHIRECMGKLEAVAMVEKFFPSSVLTIQMHLSVHIVDEVKVVGIVHS